MRMKKIYTLVALSLLLGFSANARAISLNSYQKEISKPGVTVVEYWAPWCGSCAAFKPTYTMVKRKLAGKVRFLELNVDKVDDVEKTFGLKYGLPTLILFKNGAEISKLPGGGDIQEVIDWIKANSN